MFRKKELIYKVLKEKKRHYCTKLSQEVDRAFIEKIPLMSRKEGHKQIRRSLQKAKKRGGGDGGEEGGREKGKNQECKRPGFLMCVEENTNCKIRNRSRGKEKPYNTI